MNKILRFGLNKLGVKDPDESYLHIKHSLTKHPYYWSSYPMTVQIDTTNKCGPLHSGVNCEYCFPSYQLAKKKGCYTEMPMKQIAWIHRDISEYMPRLDNDQWPPRQFLAEFLNGDPQNEERLASILADAKNVIPWLPTQTFSCGSRPEKAYMFCDSNLDWVCVTCSAPNQEVYSKVHRGLQFDNVMATMKYIDGNHKENQHLEVHYVITENNIGFMGQWYDLMTAKFPLWKKVFSPLVRSESNQPSINAMGKLTLLNQEQAIESVCGTKFWDHRSTGFRQPCVLWSNAAIDVYGNVLQCCNWSEATNWNYGNIQEYIDEGRSLRDYHKEKLANKQRNSLCRACNLKHPECQQRLKNIQLCTLVK